MTFENKLVAVLNKDVEAGVALNAVAHMSIGLGGSIERESLRLDDYQDANKNIYPSISQIPFIILRAKSNEIRKTVASARQQNFLFSVFLNTMTQGTYVEQLARTAETPEEQLIYYGCVLFGPWDAITALTKKFSLWR
jgi:hypothetical protein